ncbi:hypothetical protein [Aquimarina sp. 2201CG5-10]|uniref:hypothetical protein n=1 Tax=Aquimarina callyspongiae TaxID=3098150 RepID=UPI002AB55D64|nr:hypothetical protein [Aquimarina sp. 2201CG5-10]MDY8136038.1 hypothetical protein [Aquimarina sp. 2201CG5-10]
MKDKNDEDFNKLKSFLEEGRFTLDSPNFEEDLMSKIVLEKNYRSRVRTFIRRALACFIGGLILCMSLVLWFLFKSDSTSVSYEITSIVCLFSLGVIGVLLIDNFVKLLQNYKAFN